MSKDLAASVRARLLNIAKSEGSNFNQVLVRYGFMMEFPVAKAYVDARVPRIYGSTNEIMKEVISRSLGLNKS